MEQAGDAMCMFICIHNQAFMDTGSIVHGKAGFICTSLLPAMDSLHPEEVWGLSILNTWF